MFQLITNLLVAFSDLLGFAKFTNHIMYNIYFKIVLILMNFLGYFMLTVTLIKIADLQIKYQIIFGEVKKPEEDSSYI